MGGNYQNPTDEELEGMVNEENPEEFGEELGNPENDKSEQMEREYRLLEVLGFEKFDDRDKGEGLKYKMRTNGAQLVRRYTNEKPEGYWYAQRLDKDGKPIKGDFLEDKEREQLKQYKQFQEYMQSDKPLPPKIVVGELIGHENGWVVIKIEGQEEDLTIKYPKKAIITNRKGKNFVEEIKEDASYIPASWSVKDNQGRPRMNIPRHIIVLQEQEREIKSGVPFESPPRAEKTAEGDTKGDLPDNLEEVATELKECYREAENIYEDLFAQKYRLNDNDKLDKVLRIGNSLEISLGKYKRTPPR